MYGPFGYTTHHYNGKTELPLQFILGTHAQWAWSRVDWAATSYYEVKQSSYTFVVDGEIVTPDHWAHQWIFTDDGGHPRVGEPLSSWTSMTWDPAIGRWRHGPAVDESMFVEDASCFDDRFRPGPRVRYLPSVRITPWVRGVLQWSVRRKEVPTLLRALDAWGSCVRQGRVSVRRLSRTRVAVVYSPDSHVQHCDGLPSGYARA